MTLKAQRTLDERDLDILRFAEQCADMKSDEREFDGVGSADGRKTARFVALERCGLLGFDCVGEDANSRAVSLYVITDLGRMVLAQRRDAWRKR